MRVEETFAKASAEARAALVGYWPAGYPSVPAAIEVLRAMVDAGVDLVEIGLPYSDPVMDGPIIQQAVDVALAAGTTTPDVLRTVEAVAQTGAPTLVMSYWNPILRYGPERFARDLAAAGGAGAITPDLIPDEAEEWLAAARHADIDTVFLVAPSSTDDRLALTAEASRGFIYAASTMGVTGTRDKVSGAAEALVARLRRVTQLPIAVGLGVSNRDQAAEVAGFADGVIVGSAFVRRMIEAPESATAASGVATLAAELAEGVRRGSGLREPTNDA